jgi:Na+-transporting NADH:ubiquinone oxidoreductase subunit NqrC
MLLVAGISTPLLVIALVVLVIVTIMATVWIRKRKATKNVHNHDTEQQDGIHYATLTRQEYPEITSNNPIEILYAVVDMNKQGEEGEMKRDEENPPIPEDKKRQVALEDMYAVVNKQQKKKQNEDTPPAQSDTVDGVDYNNIAAIRKEHAVEDEGIPPRIPPHTAEKLL